MIGLDKAGKTSILNKLAFHTWIDSIPTSGFNVETFNVTNDQLQLWEAGWAKNIRHYWRHYIPGTKGLIFVVDSTDKERIDEAAEELHKFLNEPEMKDLSDIPMLIYNNKSDAEGAVSEGVLYDRLKLSDISPKIPIKVLPCSAIKNTGLFQGIDWLVAQFKTKN
jgi:ADP-ribosylation factor protein 6